MRLLTSSLLATAFAASFLSLTMAGQASKSVWDGVYTDEQAKRGEALYRTHCAECHSDTLTGQEQAPALTGVSFAATWEGTKLSDLFEQMRTSMPEKNPGSLSRQQNADILAHMLKIGQFPAGQTPLPADLAALEQIRYDSHRRTP